jgi:hypothetical protein
MYDLVILYATFAIATAIMMFIEVFIPVMQAIEGENLQVNEYRKITYFALFMLSMLKAPQSFFVCINPYACEQFRKHLEHSFREG